ncbi:MAG: hypothetical protein ACM3OB_05780 [Acidobacteriota bacterium]
MVPLVSLWMPIALSAIIVFFVSWIIHMFLGYHKNDLRPVPRQDEVQAALRPFAIPPGDYMLPRAASMKDMGTPEFAARMKEGPVAILTVVPSGPMSMGTSLTLWFLYSLVVGLFAGYIAAHALPVGAPYRAVFRFVGAVAFAGYSLALLQNSIWFKRNWATTCKAMFDGLVYALLTAGTFGWLWPR